MAGPTAEVVGVIAFDEALEHVMEAAAEAEPLVEPALGWFDRFLTVWVLLCMMVGGLLGYYVPTLPEALAKADVANINVIVALLLWLMIFPMLVQIDFAALRAVRRAPAAIALTTGVNYLVKPFTMYGLALLFFRVFYASVIPDSDLRSSYIAGLILLAAAPCTAMVFVWSLLMGGDAAYTLVQVAVNDLLMLVLFVPITGGLIGASKIEMPWMTILYAVLLFIVAPLVLAVACRAIVIRWKGQQFLDAYLVAPFKPVSMLALLATLVPLFIFQGRVIGERPLHIVLIAVPIVIQRMGVAGLAYAVGFAVCIPHARLAPASLIATSNFFELAVAVAVSVYGLNSGAALATVVGVLVEVPVMLLLCNLVNRMKPRLDLRCQVCKCKAA